MPAPPPPEKSYLEYKDNFQSLVQEQFMKRDVSVNSVYLDLDEKILQEMELTLGPLCTDESFKKVSSILKKNNMEVTVRNSSLKGQIR
jgi:hypothetical protein